MSDPPSTLFAVNLARAEERWPQYDEDWLQPILQLFLPEAPVGPGALINTKLITLFWSKKHWKRGDEQDSTWTVRLYSFGTPLHSLDNPDKSFAWAATSLSWPELRPEPAEPPLEGAKLTPHPLEGKSRGVELRVYSSEHLGTGRSLQLVSLSSNLKRWTLDLIG